MAAIASREWVCETRRATPARPGARRGGCAWEGLGKRGGVRRRRRFLMRGFSLSLSLSVRSASVERPQLACLWPIELEWAACGWLPAHAKHGSRALLRPILMSRLRWAAACTSSLLPPSPLLSSLRLPSHSSSFQHSTARPPRFWARTRVRTYVHTYTRMRE